MNHKINCISVLGVCTAALLSAPSVDAREPTIIHNYPSGENVYRVEIRNMKRFEVLESGDSDGVGELHELTVQLRSSNPEYRTQYDGEKYSGTQLYMANGGGIVSGNRNMPIRVGQHIFTSKNRRRNDETQMWVHVYSNPDDADYYGAGTVNLEISATELDCAGQRVCRRNSKGSTTISFRIPEFETPPSNRCGPSNTFRLEPLDGELQISGLSDTTVSSRVHEVPVGATWYLLTRHKKGGPRLQPFNADICIASTTRQAAIREPTDTERDLARRARGSR